jgi:hypothetical protein
MKKKQITEALNNKPVVVAKIKEGAVFVDASLGGKPQAWRVKEMGDPYAKLTNIETGSSGMVHIGRFVYPL